MRHPGLFAQPDAQVYCHVDLGGQLPIVIAAATGLSLHRSVSACA